MNWEKIFDLDTKGLYKSINGLWWLFIFYCIIMIFSYSTKFNEVIIPIDFKTSLFEQGLWENPNGKPYKVATTGYGQFELYVTTNDYPKELIISKFSKLLYLFILGFIFWQVKGLVRTIKDEVPFERPNIKRLKRIGLALIVLGFLYPIFNRYLAGLAKAYVQIPNVELRPLINFNWTYYFLGLVFLLIARVFKKGIELREENALTI